jgi:hypothetical protein
MLRMCLCSEYMFNSFVEPPFLVFLVYIARGHEERPGANSAMTISYELNLSF